MRNYIKEILVTGRYYRFQEKAYEGLLARSMREVEANLIDSGLWAKAKSMSEYDENKSKANYIKLRADLMWNYNCSNDIWKSYKAAFTGKQSISTDGKIFHIDIGDWVGSVSMTNMEPVGVGYITDIYGQKSTSKQTITYFRTILSAHPYKLPSSLISANPYKPSK